MTPDEINAAAQKIADALVGTCTETPASVAESEGIELTPELEEAVGTLACECERCGWWVNIEELNSDSVCEGCASDEEDDYQGDFDLDEDDEG